MNQRTVSFLTAKFPPVTTRHEKRNHSANFRVATRTAYCFQVRFNNNNNNNKSETALPSQSYTGTRKVTLVTGLNSQKTDGALHCSSAFTTVTMIEGLDS